VHLAHFRCINEIQRRPWASADSDEAQTRKGLGSEMYIFSSPPEEILHVFQCFYEFPNIVSERVWSPFVLVQRQVGLFQPCPYRGFALSQWEKKHQP